MSTSAPAASESSINFSDTSLTPFSSALFTLKELAPACCGVVTKYMVYRKLGGNRVSTLAVIV